VVIGGWAADAPGNVLEALGVRRDPCGVALGPAKQDDDPLDPGRRGHYRAYEQSCAWKHRPDPGADYIFTAVKDNQSSLFGALDPLPWHGARITHVMAAMQHHISALRSAGRENIAVGLRWASRNYDNPLSLLRGARLRSPIPLGWGGVSIGSVVGSHPLTG
jgi:hypothetical protein